MDEKEKELFKRWMNSKINKSNKPKHRLSNYFEEMNMNNYESFDEYFHQNNNKKNLSKEEFMKLMKEFRQKVGNSNAGMIVMFEEDYENLLEMRGFFKMSNMTNYVETINKIINTLVPKDMS